MDDRGLYYTKCIGCNTTEYVRDYQGVTLCYECFLSKLEEIYAMNGAQTDSLVILEAVASIDREKHLIEKNLYKHMRAEVSLIEAYERGGIEAVIAVIRDRRRMKTLENNRKLLKKMGYLQTIPHKVTRKDRLAKQSEQRRQRRRAQRQKRREKEKKVAENIKIKQRVEEEKRLTSFGKLPFVGMIKKVLDHKQMEEELEKTFNVPQEMLETNPAAYNKATAEASFEHTFGKKGS